MQVKSFHIMYLSYKQSHVLMRQPHMKGALVTPLTENLNKPIVYLKISQSKKHLKMQ